ncbi:MAG: hypothetical protein FD149_2722 [Rhodospirillaceae bacterium]|nr:MAG: hypothetical protein FD149_2722 [Rhodospirillaceae bacterium]
MSGDDNLREELEKVFTIELANKAMLSNNILQAIAEILQLMAEAKEETPFKSISWLGERLFECHETQVMVVDAYDKCCTLISSPATPMEP